MKHKFLSLLILLLLSTQAIAQIDRSKMPAPGPAPEIEIGEYEKFVTDNGLNVIVVNNDKLSTVTFQLIFNNDPLLEGENAGYVNITGQLLRRGTKTKTKAQIDEEIDFLGANLSASTYSISGSSLKKHSEKLFEIFADVLLNADFKQEELDKIKKQLISGLKSEKDDPKAIANNLVQALSYGTKHPYGEQVTEETVNALTLEMCKNYYNTYLKPNVAYLAVVGDVDVDDVKDLVDKYLSTWKKAEVPTHKYKTPRAPLVRKVAVVDRASAVQSVIHVTYPVKLITGSDDVIAATVANQVLGGSSFSRLFYNLREDKGYTYGAYSSLSSDKLIGSFDANCEARNAVTDSAIAEFLGEMKTIRKEAVSEKELQDVKNFLTGSFGRSLESPATIARFAVNIERYNLPKDYYKNYLKKLNAVTIEDVKKIAKKYIKPNNAHVLVVGNADEIASKLKRFSVSGKVDYYTMYGEKYDPSAKALPEGLTADNVIDSYITAIGGREKLASITDRHIVMKGEVQGMAIVLNMQQKVPGKLYQNLNVGNGMMEQKTIFDGVKGTSSAMGKVTPLEGDQLEKMKIEAQMYSVLKYKELGITAELIGVEAIDGEDSYKLKMTLPTGQIQTEYYSVVTGLMLRQISQVTTEQGSFNSTSNFKEYSDYDGIKYPSFVTQQFGPQTIELKVESVTFNKGIDDKVFEVK